MCGKGRQGPGEAWGCESGTDRLVVIQTVAAAREI